MPKEVFFNADDFGMSAEVNHAILEAHLRGALQGTGLMMGQPGTEDAIQLARQFPSLQIGFHLHLTDSIPLTVPQWPWGKSPAAAGWAIGLFPGARVLMRREIAAQWAAFQQAGLSCAFVNSHHHLHVHPFVYGELMRTIPAGAGGWLRLGTPCFFDSGIMKQVMSGGIERLQRARRRSCPMRVSDTLWGLDRLFRMDPFEIKTCIASLPKGRHEFMFHPRRLTEDRDTETLIQLREVLHATV
jgi:hypothetical protein